MEYVGIATHDLPGDYTEPKNTILEVIVPELTPMLQDKIEGVEIETKRVSVENTALGGKSETTIRLSETVTCEYLGTRSNHSIPNIHRGEQVIVYRLGETSRFYWKEMGRDDKIRTTEHLKIHIANKKTRLDELNEDTSYFFEMDTREGRRKVHIHTSKGTDEAVAYDVLINTDDNTLEIVDTIGNGIKLESNPDGISKWAAWNKEGSKIELEGKKALVDTPTEVEIRTPTTNINASNTNISGNLSVGGKTSVGGSVSLGSILNVAGLATFSGGTVGDRT